MTGADCVAIACDTRFGIQNQTNATDMPKVFKIHDRLFVGLAGLATDMMTLCVPRALPLRLRVAHLSPATRASSSATTCTACGRTAT